MLVNATLNKKEEGENSRMLINTVELLDTAIAGVANGLEIYIDDISAVAGLKQILQKDRNGKNKIYIKPVNNDWDVRIMLRESFALWGDTVAQIRSLPGITKIKEL